MHANPSMCLALAVAVAPLITIIVDASYILRGVARGRKKTAFFSNPDLWDRFWGLVSKRRDPYAGFC